MCVFVFAFFSLKGDRFGAPGISSRLCIRKIQQWSSTTFTKIFWIVVSQWDCDVEFGGACLGGGGVE
jgi:hypothetical protein